MNKVAIKETPLPYARESIEGCLEPTYRYLGLRCRPNSEFSWHSHGVFYKEAHRWADIAYYLEFGHVPGVLSGRNPRAGHAGGDKAAYPVGNGKGTMTKPKRAAWFAVEYAKAYGVEIGRHGVGAARVWVDSTTKQPVKFAGLFEICELRGHVFMASGAEYECLECHHKEER